MKTNISGTGGPHYVSAVENILVVFSPKRSMQHFNFSSEEKRLNWIQCPPVKSFYRYANKVVNHSEKPQALLTQLIEHHSRPGDLVVDLFSGSGSATVAALMKERNVLALEVSGDYVEAIKARVPLLYKNKEKEEEEEEEIPMEDPKDNKKQSAIPSVAEKVCSICEKGPESTLSMCNYCSKLGHAICTPFYEDPDYDNDEKEATFWCSKDHMNAVCDSMLTV
jgi:16S rRNA G966 N2-methylase RsmD